MPGGLSPLTWGSPSTASTPLRRLRFTTSWCHLPGSTRTLLVTTPVPEPVLNLEGRTGRLVAAARRCWEHAASSPEICQNSVWILGSPELFPPPHLTSPRIRAFWELEM